MLKKLLNMFETRVRFSYWINNMKTMRRFFGKGLQFTSCERVAETYKMERTKIYCQKMGMTVWCMLREIELKRIMSSYHWSRKPKNIQGIKILKRNEILRKRNK